MHRRTKGFIGVAAFGLTALCAWDIGSMESDPLGAGEPPLLRVEIKVGR